MKRALVIISIIGFLCVMYIHTTPLVCENTSIAIEKNDTIHDVATRLKDDGCLRYKTIFEKYGVLFNVQVKEGFYVVAERKSFFEYLFLFERTTYRQNVRITIPEGATLKEIGLRCEARLQFCNKKRFEEKTKELEGYLFPNTYDFIGNESEEDLIAVAQKEFQKQTEDIFSELSESEKKNVIILASVLEKEANTQKDMELISGILYKRLKIDMPLQIDATLFYERGKTSAQLSISDLRRDSLYNSYTNKGLPPTPIANPGMVAIRAALNPEPSPYLFYLTGNDGKMYYAKTHDEHVRNKNLYLRN